MSQQIPFGKKLVAPEPKTMYMGYPESRDRITLPAGKPSPVVESYTMASGGYYQLKSPDYEQFLYLKNTEDLTVVAPDAEDNSSFFSGLYYSVTDWFSNTDRDLGGSASYLREGFKESVKDVTNNLPDWGKSLILWVAIPVVAILLLIAIIKISE